MDRLKRLCKLKNHNSNNHNTRIFTNTSIHLHRKWTFLYSIITKKNRIETIHGLSYCISMFEYSEKFSSFQTLSDSLSCCRSLSPVAVYSLTSPWWSCRIFEAPPRTRINERENKTNERRQIAIDFSAFLYNIKFSHIFTYFHIAAFSLHFPSFLYLYTFPSSPNGYIVPWHFIILGKILWNFPRQCALYFALSCSLFGIWLFDLMVIRHERWILIGTFFEHDYAWCNFHRLINI